MPSQRVDVYFHFGESDSVGAKLDRVLTVLNAVWKLEETMTGELDALTAEVARIGDVDSSAEALIKGITAKLDAAIAAGNPAALTALSASLKASTDALSQAVVDNTPAAT